MFPEVQSTEISMVTVLCTLKNAVNLDSTNIMVLCTNSTILFLTTLRNLNSIINYLFNQKSKIMKVYQHLVFLLLLCFFSKNVAAQQWVANPASNNLLPDNYSLYGVKMVDKDVIWATASFGTGAFPATHLIKILRTTDGGKTWQLTNVTNALGHLGFDIQAFDSTTAWISTFSDKNNLRSGLFKTSDGGQTWVQKLADSVGNHHLRFFDRNNGVCINALSRRFAYTSDGGENWTIDNTSLAFNGKERSAAWLSGTNSFVRKGDTIWFGTTAGRIFRSTNKGRNWTPYSTGIPPTWVIPSLAFSDARNGMLIAVDSLFRYAGIAKTNDGGMNWQVVPMNLITTTFNRLPLITAIPYKNEKSYLLSLENQNSSVGKSFFTLDNGNGWYGLDKDIHSHGASEFLSAQIGWMGNGITEKAKVPATMFKWDDLGTLSPTYEHNPSTFFSVSPNPTQDVLSLQFEDALQGRSIHAQISDVTGRIVYQINTVDKQLTVNHLPKGLYFLTLRTGDKIGVTKFVKN
jgi:hypothetical protein